MTHHIVVDDATYATLKETAKTDGRTMCGLVKYLALRYAREIEADTEKVNSFMRAYGQKLDNPMDKFKPKMTPEEKRFKELNSYLSTLDPESDDYDDILRQVVELQGIVDKQKKERKEQRP